MSLHPDDAPPGARPCNSCNGLGSTRWHPDSFHAPAEVCIDRFCGVRRCREVTCEKCKGSGHINCFRNYTRNPNCGGFATHFLDRGEDDMCEFCWSHCGRCGEKVIEVPDGFKCPSCDAADLRDIPTAELVAASSK